MMVKRFMATQSMSFIRSKRGRAEASYGLHAALLSMELAALITAGEYVSHTSVMQEKYCLATTNFRLGGAHFAMTMGDAMVGFGVREEERQALRVLSLSPA